jgi:DNA-binding transcriptional MerR regulator
MRISDLSRQSGVPVATIKFYLREHLLPPGEPTGRNQAVYSEVHLRRLELIRVMTVQGRLDLNSVRRLLTGITDDRMPLADLLETLNAVSTGSDNLMPADSHFMTQAHTDVDRIVEDAGWQVRTDATSRSRLAQALAAMRRLGCDCTIDYFDGYVAAADQLARRESDLIAPEHVDRASVIARSLLLEQAFAAMHGLAREHHVLRRVGQVPG